MADENCIFCKIVSGVIPTEKIAESENCIAILDAFPATRGHALVITREHRADLLEMTDDELCEASMLMRDLGAAVKRSMKCEGINFINNLGAAAGQVVAHAHFHILPRYENDGVNMAFNQLKLTDDEKSAVLKAVRAEL
ncbi:MAG: HIT domain-containing protein [bacterium]